MNAQNLKNSILQLAIQGKLVEQRKEEGTAKELLQQFKAEKDQLIKEKKIKKDNPLPEITADEMPFDILENWEWVRLGDVIDIVRGASPRPIKEFITESEDGVNWIKIGDTEKGNKYINKTYEKITVEGMKKSRYVKKGDFLLSNSMSFGRPYILNIDGCIHDGWLALSQLIEIFDKEFLYYLLSSSMVYYQFCGRVSGAVVNNLNSDKVKLTVIPLPPLEEQKRIVAKIEELMPYVEKYGEDHSKLEEFNKKFPEDMQKSILQYAIQGKLVEQREEEGTAEELYQRIQEEKARLIKEGKIKKEKPLAEITEEEIPFEIPESWKWVRLENISEYIQRGKSPKYSDIQKYPVVAQKCNQWDGFSIDKAKFIDPNTVQSYAQERFLQDGDLMWNSTGLGTLGRMAVYFSKLNPFELAVADSHVTVIRTLKKYIVYKYIYFYIANPSVQNVIESQSDGSTKQKELSTNTIKNYIIPLPPLKEQKRIVAKIEEMLPFCQQLVK